MVPMVPQASRPVVRERLANLAWCYCLAIVSGIGAWSTVSLVATI